MAVENLKSTAITNLDAIPKVANATGDGASGYLRQVDGTVTPSASASTTSTYQVCRVPTNAKVKHVWFASAAQAAGKFDVGLYYSSSTQDGTAPANQGDVIDADLFASAIDAASAVALADVSAQSGVFTDDERLKPLWEVAGLTSDPGGYFDLVFTVITTAVTTGTGRMYGSVEFVI